MCRDQIADAVAHLPDLTQGVTGDRPAALQGSSPNAGAKPAPAVPDTSLANLHRYNLREALAQDQRVGRLLSDAIMDAVYGTTRKGIEQMKPTTNLNGDLVASLNARRAIVGLTWGSFKAAVEEGLGIRDDDLLASVEYGIKAWRSGHLVRDTEIDGIEIREDYRR